MDLRTVLTIFTLSIMTAESNPTSPKPISRETSITAQINNISRTCSCPSPVTATTADPTSIPSTSTLALGLLAISWRQNCKGDVTLTLHQPSNSPAHPHDSFICRDSETYLQSLLGNVCQKKIGCQGKPRWFGGKAQNGYSIKESGAEMRESCDKLMVECTVEVLPDLQGQLKAYKVVTALLCCVLLLLLLIRFTRPTVKALQKRLSNKRQNRWVGPTQSHSVSYHRGKTTVKNNDGEKRLSYPALERLAVSDSREPSSNRSSYNF